MIDRKARPDGEAVLYGQVQQVVLDEDKGRYVIPSEVREATEGRDLLTLWPMDLPRWRRVLAGLPIVNAIASWADPFDAEIVAGHAVLASEGDVVEIEASEAIVETTRVRGDVEREVRLWDVEEVRRVQRGDVHPALRGAA